jgi:uridylate kinase
MAWRYRQCSKKLASKHVCKAQLKWKQVAEPYIRRRAMRHLEKGRALVFLEQAPAIHISLQIQQVLSAPIEIKADVILKRVHVVDGIYTADPEKDPTATKYDNIYLPGVHHEKPESNGHDRLYTLHGKTNSTHHRV